MQQLKQTSREIVGEERGGYGFAVDTCKNLKAAGVRPYGADEFSRTNLALKAFQDLTNGKIDDLVLHSGYRHSLDSLAPVDALDDFQFIYSQLLCKGGVMSFNQEKCILTIDFLAFLLAVESADKKGVPFLAPAELALREIAYTQGGCLLKAQEHTHDLRKKEIYDGSFSDAPDDFVLRVTRYSGSDRLNKQLVKYGAFPAIVTHSMSFG